MVSEKNKEGGVIITPSWASEPDPSKVHWRPPIYNAEDYLSGLASRGAVSNPQPISTGHSEMSLRQFQTTSDLLAKLATDLRLAYPSFVQEFVSAEGVSLLIEVLRTVQVSQGAVARRQCLRDELNCLAALKGCMRCPEAARRMAASSTALFTLAACIMSNVNKSRVLALEMLKGTCKEGGHNAVSDAMSTMRLRFGEPTRFRFLCGMLGGACPQLLLAGLAFINAFVESAPSPQTRLYIQAELDQAGFSPHHFAKTINSKTPLCDELKTELNKWHKMFLDINKLRARENELAKEVTNLRDRLHHLEKRLQVLQEEKSVASSNESRLKSRCSELERQVTSLRVVGGSGGGGGTVTVSSSPGGGTSPAEDEGISSSGHDDPEREPLVYELYTVNDGTIVDTKQDEDTTIEEVMEELQNIINDAETDYNKDKTITSSPSPGGGVNGRQQQHHHHHHHHHRHIVGVSNGVAPASKREREETAVARHYTRHMQRSSNDLSSAAHEMEIIPDRILPHPPRRARSLYLEREYRYSMFFEDEDSADNSDSMLSSPTTTQVAEPVSMPATVDGYERTRRQQGAILAKEAQRNFIKRRETFHNPRVPAENEPVKPISPQEILPEIKMRRGSFDGLFHHHPNQQQPQPPQQQLSTSETGGSSGKNSTKIYIEHRTDDNNTSNTNCNEENDREWQQHHGAQYLRPKTTEDGIRYAADRTVFLPIRNDPSPTATQKFVLKRGVTNAGLYSGRTPAGAGGIRNGSDSSREQSVTCRNGDYYQRGLANLNHANLALSSGKVTDLPSGLY